MNVLFLLDRNHLIATVMVLTVISGLQMFCLLLCIFAIRYNKKKIVQTVLEASIACHLFILLYDSAFTLHHVRDGFTAVTSHNLFSLVIFILILLSALLICIREKEINPMIAPLLAFITLPQIGEKIGASYPAVLQITLVFGLVRTINQTVSYIKEKKGSVSVFSIKEAIDNMDFGILFCKADQNSDGEILLINQKMQDIVTVMTGKFLYNGKKFYKALEDGNVLPVCKKENVENELVYTLPDKTIWRFNTNEILTGKSKCVMLVASNVTEIKKIGDELREQNKKLSRQNNKLKAMLGNIESICMREEILQSKSRVHDVLGQQISIILRSIRENKEPNEALLKSFAEGLPKELKINTFNPDTSLGLIAKSFQDLGVSVNINGKLPEGREIQKLFYEIITEGITNSIRHGYATVIHVNMSSDGTFEILEIEDNGKSSEETIFEGGGFTNIRKKVSDCLGTFSYVRKPHFKITVKIPVGGKTE